MMGEELITTLVKEIRSEFHIPPFHKDEYIKVLINQGNQYFSSLVVKVDYEKDLIARGLLKNYVYYAHNKRTNEFKTDYMDDVSEWQFMQLDTYKEDEESEETDI